MKLTAICVLTAILMNSGFVLAQSTLQVDPRQFDQIPSSSSVFLRARDTSVWADPWDYWESAPTIDSSNSTIRSIVLVYADAADRDRTSQLIKQLKTRLVAEDQDELTKARLLIDLALLAQAAKQLSLANGLLSEAKQLIDDSVHSDDRMVWQERLGSAFHMCNDAEQASLAWEQALWDAERMENPMLGLEAIARVISVSVSGPDKEKTNLLVREFDKAQQWNTGKRPLKLIGSQTIVRETLHPHRKASILVRVAQAHAALGNRELAVRIADQAHKLSMSTEQPKRHPVRKLPSSDLPDELPPLSIEE